MPFDPEKNSADLPSSSEEPSAAEDFSPPEHSSDDTAAVIQRLQAEKKELTDQLLRKHAEIDNVRKRLTREKEEFQQYSLFKALEGFVPVLDAFDLALKSDASADEYRKGVELIYQQLRTALQKLGLEPIESVGGQFNPYMHEAVALVDTDEHEENHVLEELQRGYLFKNRLLRPARVKVAQRPSAESDAPPTDGTLK
jgi:molecular chaperone GrpE